MIEIRKTINADSRFSQNPDLTEKDLLEDSREHIRHVQKGCGFFADMLREAGRNHDRTKISGIKQFYLDFTKLKPGKDFMNGKWWKLHMTERHHLKDSVPNDVNLIDVIEMIVDRAMACKARSTGECEPVALSEEILLKAVDNTLRLLLSKIEVK